MKKSESIIYAVAVIVALIIGVGLVGIGILPSDFALWNYPSKSKVPGVWSPYRLVPLDRVVYKIEYGSDSSLDFSSLLKDQGSSHEKVEKAPGMHQFLYTSIIGELVGNVIEKRGDDLLIAYRLNGHAFTLSINGQKAIEQEKVIRNDLGKGVYVLMNSRGRIQSLRFDPDIENLSKGYFQALLAMAQIVFAEKGSPDITEWEVQEEDLGGNYVAHYRQDSLPSEGQTSEKEPLLKNFRKTKIRYLPSAKRGRPSQVQIQKTILSDGSLKATFDFRSGYLLSLNGSKLQTILFGKKKVGQVKNAIQLSLMAKETIGEKELSSLRKVNAGLERSSKSVSLSTNLSEKEAQIARHRKQLGEATLESLLSDLNAAETTGGSYPVSVFLKFKALIYLHPESSKRIGYILTAANPESLTMRVLGGALIAVGHEEAQAALVSVIKARREDTNALLVLIPALGGMAEPTVETEKVVRKFAFESKNPDIKATAQFTLGSIAGNLTVTSPDRRAKIIREFIQKLGPYPLEQEIQQTLHALGNTGSTLALSTIEKYLSHSTPHVRAAAMFALRWIESSEVDPLLAKGVSSDPEKLVRLEAAHALGLRKMTPETFRAQKEALMKDSAVEVRLTVLYNLSNVFEDFPEIKRLIKETAAKDPSKDVRKAASEIMVRYPKDYFK
jgi:hypothetical protein